jgi:type II secretory pathway component PulK
MRLGALKQNQPVLTCGGREPRVDSPTRAGGARPQTATPGARASVLIIVLWVAFGLVGLTLYFAHSMSFELRAADNRVAGLEAGQAMAGATRYVSNLLAAVETPGTLPEDGTYLCEQVPVGDAAFWLLGRADRLSASDQPYFGLVDEASKLNLNASWVTADVLSLLPRMTPDLAAAIVDWRDANSEASTGGAEDQVYQRLNPAYRCKNTNFESVAELRLVYGMDLATLFGDDANLNGVLDANENDADESPPFDDRNGRLDPGLLEYLTVYTREANTGLTNVNNQQQLAPLLQEKFGVDRANEILRRFGSQSGQGGGQQGGGQQNQTVTVRSLLEFYLRSQMTADEFEQIADYLCVTNTAVVGLVNVNTASEAVLACVPGIGTEYAASLVAHRQSNRDKLVSIAWVAEVLNSTNALQAGPYLTTRSFQCTADVVALGHHVRGFRRARFVFDTSDGYPRIVHRQDLTHLGWALGQETRRNLQLARTTR